ncbi:aminoglycoside adenylyltransferase domain-containing protein [Nocardia sp. Marseille-Q1738]
MTIPSVVDDIVGLYLSSIDAEMPDFIEGLYLEGSVAFGDFRENASDIDFIAVTEEKPDTAAAAALGRVHEKLRKQRRKPYFDGFYLTKKDLALGPDRAEGGPVSHEGVLHEGSHPDQYSPVLWHTLARYGLPFRGPQVSELEIWADDDALAEWQNNNLDRYWSSGLDRASRLLSTQGALLLSDYGTVWTVSGIARIHYTIATGDLTSKTGAGRHAREVFSDQWHPIIDEALRIRTGDTRRSHYRNRFARRRDIITFGRMAIEDAHRIYAGRSGGQDTV